MRPFGGRTDAPCEEPSVVFVETKRWRGGRPRNTKRILRPADDASAQVSAKNTRLLVVRVGRPCHARRPVGKHDNRNSMKMKRLKGQAKKKARLRRRKQEHKAAAVQSGKKASAPKKAAKAPPAAAPPSPPEEHIA
jgi:hypothetical protein